MWRQPCRNSMEKFAKQKAMHRLLASVLCCVLVFLACFSSVGAAQTEDPVEKNMEAAVAPGAEPSNTGQPRIIVPDIGGTSENKAPKGEERPDQHLDDVDYLLKYADRGKIGEGDELKPVDIVYLTLTMADWNCFGHNPTLKELWRTDHNDDLFSDNAEADGFCLNLICAEYRFRILCSKSRPGVFRRYVGF